MWSLPKGMATYAYNLFQRFIPDKQVKEYIVTPNPYPKNLIGVRKLDEFLADTMRDKKKMNELNSESVLEKVKSRLIEVMGPMSWLWFHVDEATSKQDGKLLTRKTFNAGGTGHYVGRPNQQLHCLWAQKTGVYHSSQVATTLKEKVEMLTEKDSDLFGKRFREQLVDSMKTKKESLKALQVDSSKRSYSSATGCARGGYGQKRGKRLPFRSALLRFVILLVVATNFFFFSYHLQCHCSAPQLLLLYVQPQQQQPWFWRFS